MILAYDFGTGGIKAALFGEDGRCLRDAFASYKTFYPGEGLHEQAPADWWEAVVSSTRALGDLAQVTAIGISGHSLGVVPIDAAGNLLRERVPIWSDSRAGEEAKAFGADDGWYLKTGCGFPAGLYSVFKLMWFRKHEPDWFARADRILGTKDWINFKLTGVRATDNSYASGTGVYDLRARRYDETLVAASGLPPALFPEIIPATQVLGEVLPEVAASLGLPRGVKVVAGGVDNSCMALGAGAYREGCAYASLGSSAWIAVSSAEPVLDARTKPYVFDHVVPGQYASALAIFSAGTGHTWLRDILGLDYAEMDRLAEEAGFGAHGLLFNPSLAGGSSLDVSPKMRGAFVNLDLRHTRGDMIRAVMEGVAFGLKTACDALAEKVSLMAPLRLVGGGAKTALWRQIYADVFGMPVAKSAIGQQCAALGAAVLAGVGTGVWRDFGILDAVYRDAPEEANRPDPCRHDAAKVAYRRFMAVSRMLGEWSERDF
ncbi:MAG: pentose kinase [Kiritimatiellae bacterium]|nr:pentose kinase [Kiritimatiellia bacterium]